MDYRDIKSTLVTKLEASEDRTRDHIYFYLTIDERDFRVGKLSHSARGQAVDYVINDTARRLKLTKKEFVGLVDCEIDKPQHERMWRERDP
jgi:hypothetical protein